MPTCPYSNPKVCGMVGGERPRASTRARRDVQRAKQEAERMALQMRENEARAHDLAKRHQGLLSEVENHTRTLQQARTDAEKHMQRTRPAVGATCCCAASCACL